MIRSVRVQVGNAQLARSLFDRPGLLDQGGDGVPHNLVAGSVVGGDQLVVVLAFEGVVYDHLKLGLGGFQIGLEGCIGGRVNLGDQRRQARAGKLGAVRRVYSPR